MADWTSLTYVVVDVEGNGQQPLDLATMRVAPLAETRSVDDQATAKASG